LLRAVLRDRLAYRANLMDSANETNLSTEPNRPD
jgi:hypothetical protein